MAWKPGDPKPNRDNYAPGQRGSDEFDADELAFMRAARAAGTQETPGGNAEKASSKTVFNPNNRRVETLTSVEAPGATGHEGEGDLGALAAAAAKRRREAEETKRLEEEAARKNRKAMK